MNVLGYDIPLWVIISVTLLLLVYIHYIRTYSFFTKMGVPGPIPLPFVGNAIPTFTKGFAAALEENVKKYGTVYGIYSGSRPSIWITDQEMLETIFIKEFSNFMNHRPQSESIGDDSFGKSVLNLQGDHWKHVRNMLSPAFSTGKLRQYGDFISHACTTACKKLEKFADSNEKFEAKEFFGAFAMDVICGTAFGLKVDSQTDKDDPFVKNARNIMNFGFFTVLGMMFPWFRVIMVKAGYQIFEKESLSFFEQVTKTSLEDRIASPENYKDFLQMMAYAYKAYKEQNESPITDRDDAGQWIRKGLTEKEVLHQALTFFLAGYDTTSDTLKFLAYNLAVHPECADKVIEEIDTQLRGEEPTHDNVGRLTYLQQCLDESMRLYTPGFVTDRVCNKETTLKNLTIPKGLSVMVPWWCIHRNPNYFPNPEKYDPNRFTAEEKAKRPPCAFQPFGAGPRICVAMRLALLEVKMVMAKIMQNLRFVVCEETQIPVKLNKFRVLKVNNGLWLKVERR